MRAESDEWCVHELYAGLSSKEICFEETAWNNGGLINFFGDLDSFSYCLYTVLV